MIKSPEVSTFSKGISSSVIFMTEAYARKLGRRTGYNKAAIIRNNRIYIGFLKIKNRVLLLRLHSYIIEHFRECSDPDLVGMGSQKVDQLLMFGCIDRQVIASHTVEYDNS